MEFDRLYTYAARMCTFASPRESLWAGIALAPGVRALRPRPLVIVSTISDSEPPYSQMLSVRFGAPSCWLPLPSGPCQAEHSVVNVCLPRAARAASCFAPESEST